MFTAEVPTYYYPFPEARAEGESPARLHMVFERHVNTGTVLDMADSLMGDTMDVFRKGERNVMWIENYKDGEHLQALFNLSLQKTGTILNAVAFMEFALNKNGEYSSRPMTAEERQTLMELPFGDFSTKFLHDTISYAATVTRDYQTALLRAAGKLEHKGYPVEVIFEDSRDAAPLDEEDKSFENFKIEAKNEAKRERRILAQWKRITKSATADNPVNISIHIGGAHNTLAEEASKLGDSYSVMLDTENYPDPYKSPWDKLKRGLEVSDEEYNASLEKERIMTQGSPLYIPKFDFLGAF